MDFTITVDEAIHMHNDTPNAESTPAEAYNVEIAIFDGIRKEADGLARLTGGVN